MFKQTLHVTMATSSNAKNTNPPNSHASMSSVTKRECLISTSIHSSIYNLVCMYSVLSHTTI